MSSHWVDDEPLPFALERGTGWPRPKVVVLGLAVLGGLLAVLVALALRLDSLQVRLDTDRAAQCAVWRAQAVAPAAPGAARDFGALNTAVRAQEAYVSTGCEAAGYGPNPAVPTAGPR